jgi:hypothetical protein
MCTLIRQEQLSRSEMLIARIALSLKTCHGAKFHSAMLLEPQALFPQSSLMPINSGLLNPFVSSRNASRPDAWHGKVIFLSQGLDSFDSSKAVLFNCLVVLLLHD